MILFHEYMAFLVIYMSELMPTLGFSNIEELALAVQNGGYIPATSAEGSLHKFIKVSDNQFLIQNRNLFYLLGNERSVTQIDRKIIDRNQSNK